MTVPVSAGYSRTQIALHGAVAALVTYIPQNEAAGIA